MNLNHKDRICSILDTRLYKAGMYVVLTFTFISFNKYYGYSLGFTLTLARDIPYPILHNLWICLPEASKLSLGPGKRDCNWHVFVWFSRMKVFLDFSFIGCNASLLCFLFLVFPKWSTLLNDVFLYSLYQSTTTNYSGVVLLCINDP